MVQLAKIPKIVMKRPAFVDLGSHSNEQILL